MSSKSLYGSGALAIIALAAGVAASLELTASYGQAAAQQSEPATVIRGIVRADHTATLSAKLFASVAEIAFRPGETFRKGDMLAALDCSVLEAEIDIASADLEARKLAYDHKMYLKGLGASGKLEASIARAEMFKSEAKLRAEEIRSQDCEILAPYSGSVVAWQSNPFEVARPGTPLLDVVSLDSMSIELVAPTAAAAQMRDGTRIVFIVAGSGARVPATISGSSAIFDPVSQTSKVFARLGPTNGAVMPGMSGTVQLAPSS